MTATLCAVTFSNSYVLWHKRCVMLRFVAVPKGVSTQREKDWEKERVVVIIAVTVLGGGGVGVRSQLRRKIKSFLLTLANNYFASEVRAIRSLNLRLNILNKENVIISKTQSKFLFFYTSKVLQCNIGYLKKHSANHAGPLFFPIF